MSQKENWLDRFLEVQQGADVQLRRVLVSCLEDVDGALKAIEAKPGVGAATRRAQLLGNKGVITRVLIDLYGKLGLIVRVGQSEAAEAATAAELSDSKKILSVIIEDADKRAVLERSLQQSSRRNVQTMMTRVLQTERPLSERIYRNRARSKAQISRVINGHLTRGSSAADLAKDVRKFFDPNVTGGVTYAANRLARTEINNAFHAQSMADMADRPWINQVKWNLSKSHPARQPHDACDDYAATGLYPADNIPPKPHPNCLCYVTPDMPDVDTVLNNYLAGNYNSWIAEHTDDGLRHSA
jgi:hypothetical protein